MAILYPWSSLAAVERFIADEGDEAMRAWAREHWNPEFLDADPAVVKRLLPYVDLARCDCRAATILYAVDHDWAWVLDAACELSLSGLGLSSAPPRISAWQRREPAFTDATMIARQADRLGDFSVGSRAQSSMPGGAGPPPIRAKATLPGWGTPARVPFDRARACKPIRPAGATSRVRVDAALARGGASCGTPGGSRRSWRAASIGAGTPAPCPTTPGPAKPTWAAMPPPLRARAR